MLPTGVNRWEENSTAYAVPYNITHPPHPRDENLAKIEIAVQAFILCMALFGNSCVLVALR